MNPTFGTPAATGHKPARMSTIRWWPLGHRRHRSASASDTRVCLEARVRSLRGVEKRMKLTRHVCTSRHVPCGGDTNAGLGGVSPLPLSALRQNRGKGERSAESASPCYCFAESPPSTWERAQEEEKGSAVLLALSPELPLEAPPRFTEATSTLLSHCVIHLPRRTTTTNRLRVARYQGLKPFQWIRIAPYSVKAVDGRRSCWPDRSSRRLLETRSPHRRREGGNESVAQRRCGDRTLPSVIQVVCCW
nr:hypothetical protein Iba_chr09aCG12950 [Ipomoea batatas]